MSKEVNCNDLFLLLFHEMHEVQIILTTGGSQVEAVLRMEAVLNACAKIYVERKRQLDLDDKRRRKFAKKKHGA